MDTRYFRTYNTPDGESHIEEVDMALVRDGEGVWRSLPVKVDRLLMSRIPATRYMDWHRAPRRQFVINLAGESEIEMSDGEKRRIGPGSVLLAEDTAGKGHIMRGVGSVDRVSITVPLDPD
jgi:quercetin dioxygenase-like cupin family protein